MPTFFGNAKKWVPSRHEAKTRNNNLTSAKTQKTIKRKPQPAKEAKSKINNLIHKSAWKGSTKQLPKGKIRQTENFILNEIWPDFARKVFLAKYVRQILT